MVRLAATAPTYRGRALRARLAGCTTLVAVVLAAGSAALANGGMGGGAAGGAGGANGFLLAPTPGGAGSDGGPGSGGGGGGSGVNGGAGGLGGASGGGTISGSGGAGGTSGATQGTAGLAGPAPGDGGGGGGGGFSRYDGSAVIGITSNLTGGHGGAGGPGHGAGGGGGGAGGIGLATTGPSQVTIASGTILAGGDGGAGGAGGGSGGGGGIGLAALSDVTVVLGGVVRGGTGGAGAVAGVGGIGLVGSSVAISLSGRIEGGTGPGFANPALAMRIGGISSLTFGGSGGHLTSGVQITDGRLAIATTAGSTFIAAPFSGAGELQMNGPGTITLSAGSTHTGGTSVNGGTLVFQNASPNPFGTGGLSIGVGGTLRLTGALGGTVIHTVPFLQGGAGSLVLDGGQVLQVNQGGFATFGGTVVGPSGSMLGATLRLLGGGDLVLNGAIRGQTRIETIGSTLILRGANSHSGGTLASGGELVAANSAALGEGTLTLQGGARLTAGDVVIALPNPIELGPGGGRIDNGGLAMTLGGAISGGPGDPLAFTNLGSTINPRPIRLLGANTYAGQTIVEPTGFLAAGREGVFSPNSAMQNDGRVQLNGFSQAVAGLSGSGIVENGAAAAATLRVDLAGTETFAGLLRDGGSGALALEKAGAGTLILTADNTHSGGTVIGGGTLRVGTGGATGAIGDGPIRNDGVLIIDRSADLTLAGAISGSGALVHAGTGTLTLTAPSTHAGGTTIGAGTLRLRESGTLGNGDIGLGTSALLVIDRAGALSLPGRISGNGGLRLDGPATVTLGGTNSYLGPTEVNAGTLLVNGAIGAFSQATVRPGATLGGNGDLGRLRVEGGTLSPGTAPGAVGALRVQDLTLTDGATYVVDLAGGATDVVNTFLVSIQDARLLLRVADPAGLRAGTNRVVLTSSEFIRGRFAFSPDLGLPLLEAALTQNLNSLVLSVVRNEVPISALAGTPRQAATAVALDSLGRATTPQALPAWWLPRNAVQPDAVSSSPVYNAVIALPDAAAIRRALDSLSGQPHASHRGALLLDGAVMRGAVETRTAEALEGDTASYSSAATYPGTRIAGWVQGFGGWGRIAATDDAPTLRRVAEGVAFGLDTRIGTGGLIGLAGGVGETRLRSETARATSDNATAALYGGVRLGDLMLRAGAAHTWHDLRSSRGVTYGAVNEQLSAKHDATTSQVFGEIGYGFRLDGVTLEPFAGLAHVATRSDAFTETGGPAALRVERDTDAVWVSTVGLRAGMSFHLGGARIAARGMLGWRHTDGDVNPAARVAFAAGGTGFEVNGTPIARDAAVVDLGLSVALTPMASIAFAYGGQVARGEQDNSLRAKVMLRF